MKKYSPDETLFIPVMLCSYVIFIVYLTFCFYCNFELLIKFSITNIIRLIALFHLWIIKTHGVWTKWTILSRTAWQKLFRWRSTIPPKRYLIYVEVRSHLGGMNQFSHKRFVFTKQNIRFCRNFTQLRRLTWFIWFFS